MVDECWEAGHRGDYEANHVFGEAVEGGPVSADGEEEVWEILVKLRTSARIRS